jgi:hypothetical protein
MVCFDGHAVDALLEEVVDACGRQYLSAVGARRYRRSTQTGGAHGPHVTNGPRVGLDTILSDLP